MNPLLVSVTKQRALVGERLLTLNLAANTPSPTVLSSTLPSTSRADRLSPLIFEGLLYSTVTVRRPLHRHASEAEHYAMRHIPHRSPPTPGTGSLPRGRSPPVPSVARRPIHDSPPTSNIWSRPPCRSPSISSMRVVLPIALVRCRRVLVLPTRAGSSQPIFLSIFLVPYIV